MFNKIQAWDEHVIEKVNSFSNKFLDHIMVFFTKLGNSGIIWATIATLLLIKKSNRTTSLKIFFALVLSAIMGEFIIKYTVGRVRPSENISKDKLLIRKPKTYSFPSGHTSSSFSSALVISTAFPYPAIVISVFILASIIAFSRIYLKVHYPTDVFAGIILGFVIAFLVEIILT